jgi:hypothetical protein
VVARCGHYIFTSSTAIDSLDIELCTGCELRVKVRAAANAMTVEDQDEESSDNNLKEWRKCRIGLANFEYETEGTDGCSAGYECTLEQQKKLLRDVTLRFAEGDELEQLKAEMDAKEIEERAATAAAIQAGIETTTTTTNGHAQIANANNLAEANSTTYASKSALKGARAGRGLSTQINHNGKRPRSPPVTRAASVTFAASADVDGDEDSHAHREEDSYRPSSHYHRSAPRSIWYTPGLWAPLPRHPWLDTSGNTVTYDRWDRLAMDNHSQVPAQPIQPAQPAQPAQLRRSERLRPQR